MNVFFRQHLGATTIGSSRVHPQTAAPVVKASAAVLLSSFLGEVMGFLLGTYRDHFADMME